MQNIVAFFTLSFQESRLLTTVPLLQACLPPEQLLICRGRRFFKSDWPILHEKVAKATTLLLYPGPEGLSSLIQYSCLQISIFQ